MSEHDGLGLDSTDTPSDDSETVNHSGMTVSSDDRVGIKNTVSFENNWRKPLQVDLMNDTVAGWYDSQVVKGFFTPLKESESFLVADELELFVLFFCIGLSGNIHLN